MGTGKEKFRVRMQQDKQIQIKNLCLEKALQVQSMAPSKEEPFDVKDAIEAAEAIYEYLLEGFDAKGIVLAGPTAGLRSEDLPSGK